MTKPDITLKRGQTFEILGQYGDFSVDGSFTPESIAAIAFSSQVRNSDGDLITTLTITKLEVPGDVDLIGKFKISALAGTENWPQEVLFFDIKTLFSGVTTYSDTYEIQVLPSVTHP